MQFDPSIFKGYDIRGIWGQNIDNELGYQIGLAYAAYVKPQGEVLIGEDVRIHSHELKESVIRGLVDAGVTVLDVEQISTDMYYYGVGKYQTDGGIQVTASHNPPEWHGMKMVKKGPVAMTLEEGIGQIRDLITSGTLKPSDKKGAVRTLDLWDEFSDYILGWIKGVQIKPMKVVINPNFGYAGKIFERIIQRGNLPIELVPLNNEPNGNFPKGRPDPFVPENRDEFIALVKSSGADLGITWDADADRVFFAADDGTFVEPYYLNTVLIKLMLKKFPGEKVIYDPRYQWALIEAIEQSGGIPTICVVGHSYIKQKMREENALFATESSGHTYYRDFWYADCGMIPAVQVLEFLSTNNMKLSDAVRPVMQKYIMSGEINSEVADKVAKMDEIAEKYKDGKQSRLDGIAVEYPDYRFCVRPSNTESLLRLTLEARSQALMEKKRDEILAIIRS